jgi:uncharacterized protein with HEPN domain
MRDKLIHEYFGVDIALVWDVVERELTGPAATAERLSDHLANEPGPGV